MGYHVDMLQDVVTAKGWSTIVDPMAKDCETCMFWCTHAAVSAGVAARLLQAADETVCLWWMLISLTQSCEITCWMKRCLSSMCFAFLGDLILVAMLLPLDESVWIDVDLVDVEKLHQEASDVKCFCCACVDGTQLGLRTWEGNCCLRSASIADCCSKKRNDKSCYWSPCCRTSCPIAVHKNVEIRDCFCWEASLLVGWSACSALFRWCIWEGASAFVGRLLLAAAVLLLVLLLHSWCRVVCVCMWNIWIDVKLLTRFLWFGNFALILIFDFEHCHSRGLQGMS